MDLYSAKLLINWFFVHAILGLLLEATFGIDSSYRLSDLELNALNCIRVAIGSNTGIKVRCSKTSKRLGESQKFLGLRAFHLYDLGENAVVRARGKCRNRFFDKQFFLSSIGCARKLLTKQCGFSTPGAGYETNDALEELIYAITPRSRVC